MFKRFRNMRTHFREEEFNRKLGVLEDAISDVGCWNWWTADFPNFILLEFVGVQIWTKPTSNESPPSGHIGITFENPYSVSFITRELFDRDTPENWIDLLHNDKLELPEIVYKQLTFNNIDFIEQIIKDSKKIDTVFGNKPTDSNFKEAEIKFGFWAINFGCIISCKSIKVISDDGELTLDDVKNRNDKWWEYWKLYWEKKNTNSPLPEDYACEVTIPAG